MALAFLGGLVTYGLIAVVVKPITEGRLFPAKTLHTNVLSTEFDFEVPIWSLLVVSRSITLT